MRREPVSIGTLLKVIAPFAAIGVVYWFLTRREPLEELKYELSRLDPLYVALAGVFVVLLFVPPILRLVRERRIWMVLKEPFELVRDPFIDIDMHEEAYGHVMLSPSTRIKHVAVAARKDDIVVRKAAYPKLFPTFRIAWKDIRNVYFVAAYNSEVTGEDDIGMARITLSFAEETVLVLPWRRNFNSLIPPSAGLQEESFVQRSADGGGQ